VSDHTLTALTALGGPAAAIDRFSGVTIRENPDLAMASAATRMGRDADMAARAKRLIGIALPGPGGLVAAGDWSAFWTSPGQWMLTAPFVSHEDIAAIARGTLGDAASVTEQTDGWVRFEIEGPLAVPMLQRLCNADVVTMRAGQATRCQIEHLGTFLLCQVPGTGFSLLTLRSGAASMRHALVTAAQSL